MIKKFIQNWLGVHNEPPRLNEDYVKMLLALMVEEALYEALVGVESPDWWREKPSGKDYSYVRGCLQRCVDGSLYKIAEDTSSSVIKSHLEGEEFLDAIIERIKRKQLN